MPRGPRGEKRPADVISTPGGSKACRPPAALVELLQKCNSDGFSPIPL
jgi:hypothetical protein